jgi:hypothetical protein
VSKIVALLSIKYFVYVLSLFSLQMQLYIYMNLLTVFSSAAAGHPWIKFYIESNVKVPASMLKRKKRILAVKGDWLEECPLPLSPCKRERRAQFTNSVPTEYGEDESLMGVCRVCLIQNNQSLISKQQGI